MTEKYLAKKPSRDAPAPTVAEHCRDVCTAAEQIVAAVGHELVAAMTLDSAEFADIVVPYLRAAALLHDIAKVNSAFQGMLRSSGPDAVRQPVRHEILAAWMLTDAELFGSWLAEETDPRDLWPIVWAIAGHHLKMGDPARGYRLFDTGSGTRTVSIPFTSSDVRELIHDATAHLGCESAAPDLQNAKFDTADDGETGLEQRIAEFAERSYRAWSWLRLDVHVARRISLLKALLIAADVAASALTANEQPLEEWIAQKLATRIAADDLAPIITKSEGGNQPRKFQLAVGDSKKSATIVVAGCGNGKTTAAYRWAQRWAVGKKLWFTYPTTGTASAGYEGYLYDHPDLLSALIHNRAEVDLQGMRGTAEDDLNDEWLRLESLRVWGQQAVICTVDTVLGLLQNQRRPLFSFPAIAAGAFVFDEIHSYDGRLFGALLRFLQLFPGVPVLLMSASIPPTRLAALREVLGDRAGEEIRGDATLEDFQRYRIEARASESDCRASVVSALRAERKVLWVCNTVVDAVREAREARNWSGLARDQIIVFHSRFRYRDRVKRQKEVIAEFKYHADESLKGQRMKPRACLVFATQVCEMSLDISSDLLVTAECPLPSLVQRLGRLNRFAAANDPWLCVVYPFQGDPYNERSDLTQTRGDYRAGMDATRDTVQKFSRKSCSQCDLSKQLDKMIERETFETRSAWLDDGWLSEPAQLRDGDASITLIRDEDLDEIEQKLGPEYAKHSKWSSRSLVPWTIPMLYRRDCRMDRRAGGYPITERGTVAYCDQEGAAWQTKTK